MSPLFFSTGQPCPGTRVSFDDMFGKMQLIHHSRVDLNLISLLMVPGQSVFLFACMRGIIFLSFSFFLALWETWTYLTSWKKEENFTIFSQIVSDEWGPRQMFSFSPPLPNLIFKGPRNWAFMSCAINEIFHMKKNEGHCNDNTVLGRSFGHFFKTICPF